MHAFTIIVHFCCRHMPLQMKKMKNFERLANLINSFFFNLLMCGYVEDFYLGESFSIVQTEKINLFVEVWQKFCYSAQYLYIIIYFFVFACRFRFCLAVKMRWTISKTLKFISQFFSFSSIKRYWLIKQNALMSQWQTLC